MLTIRQKTILALLLASSAFVSAAWADERIEMSTYVPAASNTWDRVHAGRATVGDPYSITNPTEPAPPNGTLLVSGRIGIGTASPTVKLDVAAGNAIRLGNLYLSHPGAAWVGYDAWSDGVSHFFPQAGQLPKLMGMDNDKISFWHNTNRTFGGWVHQMSIYSNGNVDIGPGWGTAPVFRLNVQGQACATGGFSCSSDVRLKTNVKPLTNVLEKLAKIQGVSFEWNDLYRTLGPIEKDRRQIGVIAQEVESVFPELVSSDGRYKAVDYGRLTSVLLEGLKELKVENETLRQKVEIQDRRIEALERNRLARKDLNKASP